MNFQKSSTDPPSPWYNAVDRTTEYGCSGITKLKKESLNRERIYGD